MPSSDLVTLAAGRVLPWDVVQLSFDLERRGMRLWIEGEKLKVSPRGRITLRDAARITRHRDELMTLVRHCDGTLST